MTGFSKIKKPANVILFLFLGLIGLFFIFLFIEIFNKDHGFSWYRSYKKNYDQPYDCKLVVSEIEGLFPGKSIKSFDGESLLLEEYQEFTDQIDDFETADSGKGMEAVEDFFENSDIGEEEYEELQEEDIEQEVKEPSGFDLDFYILTQIEEVIANEYYDLPDVEKSNIVIVGNPYIQQNVVKIILTHAYAGNSVLIATEDFSFLNHFIPIEIMNEGDVTSLKFEDDKEWYAYKGGTAISYFSNKGIPKEIIKAVNDNDEPILLQIPFGEGFVFLSSTPVAFTNYNLLKKSNVEFIEKTFSLLPVEDVYWADNYIFYGESNQESKLDYIRKQPPLWWAFNVALYTMIVFMVFGIKRKQRLIPNINAPVNSTLEFVRTMAQLYLQSGEHKLLATKKIRFFLDFIRKKYHLETDLLDVEFTEKLAKSSGKNINEVSFMIRFITQVAQDEKVNRKDLIILHRTIEKFKSK